MIHVLRADQPVHFRLPTGEILALWWDENKRKFETLQAPESVFHLYQPIVCKKLDIEAEALQPQPSGFVLLPDEILMKAEQAPVGGMG